jgi:hypothetical protein
MEKFSDKEAALLAAARRDAARRAGSSAPAVQAARAAFTSPGPAEQENAKPSPAERLALLMAEERAETERRKKKMRRYGIVIPLATVAIFALWVLRASLRRR